MQESREKVRRLLRRGIYDDISLSGWGRLDDFVAMMVGLGIFDIFCQIRPAERNWIIPRWFIYNSLAMKEVLGEASLNGIQDGMFRDDHVLRLVGCTARQIREGFDLDRNKGDNKPCNIDSLSYGIGFTPPSEIVKAFRSSIKATAKTGILRRTDGTFVMDSTKIVLDGDYAGMGQLTKLKQILTEDGKITKEITRQKGFKLCTINLLYRGRLICVGARLIPINEHEVTTSDELIEEASQLLGGGAIRVLLIDRGYIDGERFSRWKQGGIDIIIPLKSNMNMLEDMQGLARIGEGLKIQDKEDGLELLGFEDLESLESYNGYLGGLLVTRFRGKEIPPERQWGFITTLPLNTPKRVLRAYAKYDDRSLIENKEYREMKQGWHLKKFWGKGTESIYSHIYFSLIMFNLVGIHVAGLGDKFRNYGIRRLRRDQLSTPLRIIVYVDRYFAFFTVREFMTILARPPTGKNHDARRIFGKPPNTLCY
jgi:hypothetical protein